MWKSIGDLLEFKNQLASIEEANCGNPEACCVTYSNFG